MNNHERFVLIEEVADENGLPSEFVYFDSDYEDVYIRLPVALTADTAAIAAIFADKYYQIGSGAGETIKEEEIRAATRLIAKIIKEAIK